MAQIRHWKKAQPGEGVARRKSFILFGQKSDRRLFGDLTGLPFGPCCPSPAFVTARRVIYFFWCQIRPITFVPSYLHSTPNVLFPPSLPLPPSRASQRPVPYFSYFIFPFFRGSLPTGRSENVGRKLGVSSIKISQTSPVISLDQIRAKHTLDCLFLFLGPVHHPTTTAFTGINESTPPSARSRQKKGEEAKAGRQENR